MAPIGKYPDGVREECMELNFYNECILVLMVDERDEERKERLCQYISLGIGSLYLLIRLGMFMWYTFFPQINQTADQLRVDLTLALLKSMRRRQKKEDAEEEAKKREQRGDYANIPTITIRDKGNKKDKLNA